jgi:hypothetical protein
LGCGVTVGIGIAGPGAGGAALAALEMVERVGRGMIGGFVSFAALDAKGRVQRAETQRGGARALFPSGMPALLAEAPVAVLMSSGPDRAPPLSQFTPAEEGVGCISGHRLPNMPGAPGAEPMNVMALRHLRTTGDPTSALATTLAAYPDADAGLIAVTASGAVAAANSQRVAARSDAGELLTELAGLRIAILHNSIFPHNGLAEIAAGAAVDAVAPGDAHDFEITLEAGLSLSCEPPVRVEIDTADRVIALRGLPEGWQADVWQGAAAMQGAPVYRAGQQVGTLVSEAYCVARNGRLESCDGTASVRLKCAASP